MSRGALLWSLVGVVAFVIAIQFVPVAGLGRNPAARSGTTWSSPAARVLAERACYDCHSDHTRWPWYSRVAPFSWVVAHHVSEARSALDFSNPPDSVAAAERAARAVTSRSMPPFYYVWLHPQAELTPSERQTLAEGLLASIGRAPGTGRAVSPAPRPGVPVGDVAPLPGGGPGEASDAGARAGGPGPAGVSAKTGSGAAGAGKQGAGAP